MIKLVVRILFLVVSGWWVMGSLVGCAIDGASTLDSYQSPIQPFGVLGPGEANEVLLPTTLPEDVEDDPRLILDVTFFDEFSGEQLAGDVEVFKQAGSVEAGAIARVDAVACVQQLRCVIAVRPTGGDDVPWTIELRAAGYVTQKLELRANALSTQKLEMPVQLRPVGLDG